MEERRKKNSLNSWIENKIKWNWTLLCAMKGHKSVQTIG